MSVLGDLLKSLKVRSRVADAYRDIYGLPAGKIVIDDLLKKSGLLEVSPAEDCRFYDGRRSMGLEILAEMRWSEGELVQLAKEQTAERFNQEEEVI